MRAVILAAGLGRRLGDPWGRPKCMCEIGGWPLIHHQMAALARAQIRDVVVVVGHAQEQIRASLGATARYVVNDRFAETNSMYSFLLAGERLCEERGVCDDVVVLNSDLLFHPALLDRLFRAHGTALLYDSTSGDEAEHMKVRVEAGRLLEMSKAMSQGLTHGENLGMLLMTGPVVAEVVAAARIITALGGERSWLASAINRVAPHHPISCVDVAGMPWVEIDFPDDLMYARAEVYPAITGVPDRRPPTPTVVPSFLESAS